MPLDVLGFRDVNVVADWDSYRKALPLNKRPIHAVCMSARIDAEVPSASPSPESEWVQEYEARMATTLLPESLIEPLHSVICHGGPPRDLTYRAWFAYLTLNGPRWVQRLARWLALRPLTNPTSREIVSSFPYCPIDKVRLEYAKHLLARNEPERALDELQKITRRPNADWRACYRAFYLQWRASRLRRDEQAAERSRLLCLTCNPHFPPALFVSPPPFQE
jgi:hypothetical protein